MTALQTFLASIAVAGAAFVVALLLPWVIPNDRVTVVLLGFVAGGAALAILWLWWAYARLRHDPRY